MKAVEFVKKFGWEEAKKKNSEGDNFYVWRRDKELFKDLKRLVESHDLVESCGGISVVKQHLKVGNVFRFEEKPLMRQAIADVESCK